MGYAIGIVLALCVSVFARVVGLDRDRAFYPTVLVVIASYYVLFAVMGGHPVPQSATESTEGRRSDSAERHDGCVPES